MVVPGGTPQQTRGADFEKALAAATRGESDGFRWLYAEYNRRVGALVRSEACPNPDEVVNSVFFKAFRSIDRFVGNQANFAGFLHQIARFQIIDEKRAKTRQGVAKTEPDSTMAEALAALTFDQREVLGLRVFFGLTGPETAEALDAPVATVRSLQHRAEARLRTSNQSEPVTP